MKQSLKPILRFWPYLLLTTVVASIALMGLSVYFSKAPKKHLVEKKIVPEQKRDRSKVSQKPDKAKKKIDTREVEIFLADAQADKTSVVLETTLTVDETIEEEVPTPVGLSVLEPEPEPEPGSEPADAPMPVLADTPTPALESIPKQQQGPKPKEQPKSEPGELGPLPPPPAPTSVPPLAIISDTVLTAEQAESLQGLYPGISAGWTIKRYNETATWFFDRYEKWGRGKETPLDAFIDFIRALDGEKPEAKRSSPKSWLKLWRTESAKHQVSDTDSDLEDD